MKPDEYLDRFIYHVCSEAQEWLKTQPSLADAWNNCEHGGWMWWALMYDTKGNHITREIAIAFAQFCVKRANGDMNYVRAAINAANRIANSYDYASDAAEAADYTVAAVASDVAAFVSTLVVAEPTRLVIPARSEIRRAQADWIRKHVKNPFLKG